MACLTPWDVELLLLPVDGIQGQFRDFPAPEPIGDQKKQNRIITLTISGPAVNALQHPLYVVPVYGAWNIRHTVLAGAFDSKAQITIYDSFSEEVSQEHPKGTYKSGAAR